MALGTLGDIAFEVSTEKIRTFHRLRRRGSARFATHDVLGKKPVKEFIGPGLESIGFTMFFSVSAGLNPLNEIKKLRELRDKGDPLELVIGGAAASENLWVIEEVSEEWVQLDNKGNLLFARIDIDLQEYPRDSDATATATNASAAAASGEEESG
ncbi:MAG: phage tail protein [Sporomusaceae bacterium]|nr:phage tail protein [Sporomusaceae bacterium]